MSEGTTTGEVVAVARDAAHRFSKTVVEAIELVAGLGVAGDAHAGVTVKHRSRVAKDPSQPKLRQVHLIHVELLDSLAPRFGPIAPGALGENLLVRGIDLLALPEGTRLVLGDAAEIEVTGRRNPCVQIDRFRRGLMGALLDRDAAGGLVRKGGVMGVVLRGGTVRPGDAIRVLLPDGEHRALSPV
jgi:MOSC domain-containing protein YiiM